MTKRRITAADLVKEIEISNGAHVSSGNSKETDPYSPSEIYCDHDELIRDLSNIGISIKSIWDLVNSSIDYEKAIPILIEHLYKRYSSRTLEGILRSLATNKANYAWNSLVRLYLSVENDKDVEVKDALAVAIAGSASPKELHALIELALDPKNGPSRLLLLRPIRNSRTQMARLAVDQLALDPDLRTEISTWNR